MDSPKTKRILVVDDENDLLHYLTLLLARRTGHEVEQADTAIKAMEMLRQTPYHLVISDIHMPGMTGVELLREIKGMNPDIEVVLLTGQASLDSAVNALQMQAYDYIEKPVNAERLVQTVRNALAKQSLAEELARTIEQVAALNRDLKRQMREHIGSQIPRERIATAAVLLDHLERTVGPELAQTGAFLGLRAAIERRRPERESVDLVELVRAQSQELAGVFPWIELELELPDRPIPLAVEPGGLGQVLRIVMENAVQAMHERGALSVGARSTDTEVLLRVRDEGPGFAPAALEAPAEPLAGDSAGTGLGLLIARRIVAQHGGTLELANAPGEGGGQITIRLPVNPPG